MIPASKENACDDYLTSLAKDMMLPYVYDLPQPYVNRTLLSMELAEMAGGRKHLGKQEVQHIVGKVYEDADVTRVYEDLKGMVYDDTVDAFPRDKGRFETIWVGNLEESEATEYVGKFQADTSVMMDMGTGLKELGEPLALFYLRDVFHIVRAFSEVFYFDRKRHAFVFVSPLHRVAFQEQMTQRSEL
ncbi:unnamed protein product [Symbiodinium sp. CCMP2592]|nr:unnamed protein product [Symbiodinium sp. CCMP2592]